VLLYIVTIRTLDCKWIIFNIILPQTDIDHSTVITNPDFFKERIFLWSTV